MATRADLQELLEAFSEKELDDFNKKLRPGWRCPGQPGSEPVIRAILDMADRNDRYKLVLHRKLGLSTNEERQNELSEQLVDEAARSADAAEQSAISAAESAGHARSSKTATRVGAFAALAAAIVSLLINCRPEA